MSDFEKAKELIKIFKGNSYIFGPGALDSIGDIAFKTGKTAIIFRETFSGSDIYINKIVDLTRKAGVDILKINIGAKPNAPREDLFRITKEIKESNPDMVISFGGGSTIDAVKAATVLYSLGGDIDDYFGVDKISSILEETGKELLPHIAIQTLASSGAHLTKYSNITDITTSQKKLIIDNAITPTNAIFDFSVTYNTPLGITSDGALDGMSHIVEVLYSMEGKSGYDRIEEIANIGIELIVKYLPIIISNPEDKTARNAMCYATDLGGYAIMIGGTNGGHLTSFSLVDILSHGRACAIMNPYYSVFFAPRIERSLRLFGNILARHGYSEDDYSILNGKALGVSVAKSMFTFAHSIGFPTTLDEVVGFTQGHIEKALAAAKNPQLASKLQNMPVPLKAEMVDEYMRPILEAARIGDLDIIKNVNS